MWQNSKVLITGASGMVGNHVRIALEQIPSVKVYCPSRDELNLELRPAVEEYFEKVHPDYVFHFAGRVHGLGGNLMFPIESLSANIRINDSVLTACKADSVKKVFFAGTVASYGYPFESLPLRESDLLLGEPHSGEYGYASAKRIALTYLNLLRDKFSKKFVYGVYTNLYGPHDRFNIVSGHVVPSLVMKIEQSLKDNKPLVVWGNPSTTRDFLFSEDACNAAIHLMECAEGVINIGSGVESTMKSVIEGLVEISNFQNAVLWDEAKPIGIKKRYSDISVLRASGYLPRFDLKDGLRKTWTWYTESLSRQHPVRS
jgi:GDP-L-fucose synthase